MVEETTIEETGVGVGVTSTLAVGVALVEIKGKPFFKESLPVNTAKKTITTTNPKINDKTLLKLSI